jgi:4,5-dihydroxyphthalate decarboxylase
MIENPDAADELHQQMIELGADPLPYGIDPNRQTLETLVAHAQTQKILTQPIEIESLFAPSTHSLTG